MTERLEKGAYVSNTLTRQTDLNAVSLKGLSLLLVTGKASASDRYTSLGAIAENINF